MTDAKISISDPAILEKIASHESMEKSPMDSAQEEKESKPTPPYTRFSKKHKILIIGIVTVAAFLGPASGAIYLPALPVFERVFDASTTTINATVSVFMVFFAVAVCNMTKTYPGSFTYIFTTISPSYGPHLQIMADARPSISSLSPSS